MNHTQNYQLSQWAKSDQVKMEDFNANNAKLDGALKTQADTLAAVQAQLPGKGTCTVETFTYTGNGLYREENPTLIYFRKKPSAFIIIGGDATMIGTGNNSQVSRLVGSGTPGYQMCSLSWSGGRLSFFDLNNAEYQMNRANTLYIVIAFYPAP